MPEIKEVSGAKDTDVRVLVAGTMDMDRLT